MDPQSSDLPGVTVQRTDPAIRMQAQLIGTLVVDPTTNCLLLRTISIGGTPLIDVAWPLGWSVAIRDGAPALLDTTGATAAHVGDDVAVGGGFVEVERADAVPCTGQQHVFEASGLSRL
ncbi:MAG: hypothetical protein HOV67_34815 [Kribbellaceae bacterium]|nr:hypothetical protein [Kribbellaceae bacterium]